ncbi:uncharacterized protein LOC123540441 [Mercenaria mercenaria]|uniref:uncharacterized protein LOC123540441 n=1 Tax=Mercenaria mercenaria TaxID=6596 RepID=UPI00234ECE73|nr:uncharacterized protein LOC123540441 [Mercenaria mercenaria]
MEATPPAEGKKGGKSRQSSGISPADYKVYSRRERKPKVWKDFETEETSESQGSKKGLANKSAGEVKVKEGENKIIENESGEDLTKEQKTPVKHDKERLTDTSAKKGKRRSRKVNNNTLDVTNIKIEKETDSQSAVKAKKAQTHPAVDGRSKRRKIAQVSHSIKDSVNDLDERLIASKEEIEALRNAVESKRTSKYIEKCDRVIEKGVTGKTVAGGNSLNEISVKTEQDVTDTQNGNDSKNNASLGETNKTPAKKKTPGRRKGKLKKSIIEENTSIHEPNDQDVNNSVEQEHPVENVKLDPNDESFDLLNTPVSAPVRRKGRRKALEEPETSQANTPESAINPNLSIKRRRRKKKSIGEEADDTNVDLNVSQGSRRKGRKRKEVNYAALDDGDLNGEDVKVDNVERRLMIKKERNSEQMEEDFKDNDGDSQEIYTASSRKTPSKKGKSYKCSHCDCEVNGIPDIQKHYAIHHQLWWTEENPEGSFDRSDWAKVFKLKKYLNCTKCDKQINFVTYYPNHYEWCGREHLTYTCEHCKRDNLVLRWQQLHLKTCPALVAQFYKEKKKKENELKVEEEGENLETPGRGRRRKAAKKAMSMVQNISKEMDPSAYSDFSDDDPDVVIAEDDDEEDDDDEDDDDINEEEEFETPEEDDEEDIDDESGSSSWQRAISFNPYPLMEEFVRGKWSQELFLDWLPRKQDWKQLSQQESEPYLPRRDTSIRFCFHKNESPATLEMLQSTTADGNPLFYTGLTVWKMAWCPVTFHCSDDQFLAVTGKTDRSQAFLTNEQRAGHGLIQIWNTGITSNKLETKAVPKLCYNMVHDYGLVTQMVWCPSGCYKTNDNQADTVSHTRLGLLAVAFTDGTCRIFSVPLLPVTTDGAAPTYRAKPVITLIPNSRYQQDNSTCSSVDWIKSQGHSKVITGYSTGAVRLFNLLSKSPFQRLTTENEVTLLPYMNIQPHGNLVRAAQFCSTLDTVILTSSDDFETTFWDLNNLGSPLHCDGGSYMTTSMSSSLWQHGMFIASDENYTVLSNKGRYIESGHLQYVGQPLYRKNERGAYYLSSQPACIWDIQCSDWVGFVVTCDNRGCIFGLPLRDFLKMSPDCKSYKYRQILLRTKLREDTGAEKKETDESLCNLNQSEQCKKCNCVQSANSLHNDNFKEDQSETSLQCSCKTSDQTSFVTDLSSENQTNDRPEIKVSGVEDTSPDTKKGGGKQRQSYQTLVNNSVLHFKEHVKVPKFCPHDKDSDRYDRPSVAAIKSLSFNPNHLQCCWLAYGGNTGLVRLVNVQKILARVTQNHLKDKKQY